MARPMVLLLLGRTSVLSLFFRSYAIAFLWPIHIANLQALNALGRSDIFLKLEIIKKLVGLAVAGIRAHLVLAAFKRPAADFLCTFINAWPNKKLLDYSIFDPVGGILSPPWPCHPTGRVSAGFPVFFARRLAWPTGGSRRLSCPGDFQLAVFRYLAGLAGGEAEKVGVGLY